MTAEIFQFPQRGVPAAGNPHDAQTGVACEVSAPQLAALGPSQMSRTWTDDELDGVKIDIGMYWDTFKFEICKDSPLHAKLYALLGQ